MEGFVTAARPDHHDVDLCECPLPVICSVMDTWKALHVWCETNGFILVPYVNTHQKAAKEVAAAQMIGSLHKAQMQYMSQYGRYAQNLAELGPAASGKESAAAAGIIPRELAAGKKTGYLFQLLPPAPPATSSRPCLNPTR